MSVRVRQGVQRPTFSTLLEFVHFPTFRQNVLLYLPFGPVLPLDTLSSLLVVHY